MVVVFLFVPSAQMFSVYWWLWGQEKGLFFWDLAQRTLTVSSDLEESMALLTVPRMAQYLPSRRKTMA